jgi:hypothetical protein
MTFEDFRLNQNEQLKLLSEHGVYMETASNAQSITTYQMDSFYVEIHYYRYRLFVSRIKCTGSTSILDPYLDQVETGMIVN